VIGWVAKDTPAAKAGFQVGDRITRIDGVENPTWKQVDLQQALSPGQPLAVSIDRKGQTIEKTVVPEATGPDQIGYAGWAPKEDTVTITDLQDKMTAFPRPAVRRIVEAELGGRLEEHFSEFDEAPVAAASVAQVHRARLRQGDAVLSFYSVAAIQTA
jgi:membrane-associated protease RseP (regulator of RpoE activity)